MSETKLFAVAGRPVIHSRSPQVFNSLFEFLKIQAAYFRLAGSHSQEIVQTAKSMNLTGFNITAPFKSEIIEFLDDSSEEVKTINAVNTVILKNGKWLGYNTDHQGVVDTLTQNGIAIKNSRFAILGAGGAARAAAYGVLRKGAKKVVLLNRTVEKAREAASRLECEYVSFDYRADILKESDILIACLSTGQRIVQPEMLHPDLVVLDANYRDSILLKDAERKGCRTLNGREWLVNQAFPAFKLFTEKKAPPDLRRQIFELIQKDISPKSNIAFMGFMGTGKTTVGKILAEKMQFRFVDMDTVIEESTDSTISKIFEEKGEPVFRELERRAFQSHIPGSRETVFSLGGGAVLDEENRSLLKNHCRCVWLWSSVQSSLNQIGESSRPLLDGSHPEETARSLLSARIPLYARTSDMALNTETGSTQEIAERIQNEMDQTL